MLDETVLLSWTAQFLYIFLRVAALFTLSPVLGKKNAPPGLKILLSLFLTYVLINLFPPVQQETGLYEFINNCIKELITGLSMGFVTTLFFSAVLSAGHIIDTQIGFGMAQLFDQRTESQVPLVGNMLHIFFLVLFFITNSHHTLIRILAETFVLMPPGNFEINLDIGVVMVEFFLLTVALTLRLAMPVMAAMFITETALGIVIRTVPQMNMFVVGIPIKIIVGFVVMVLTVPVFFGLSGNMFDLMFTSIRELARRMVL